MPYQSSRPFHVLAAVIGLGSIGLALAMDFGGVPAARLAARCDAIKCEVVRVASIPLR
jgi:UDP-N-acetyl-D-mannosaminuronate dehydrogenase